MRLDTWKVAEGRPDLTRFSRKGSLFADSVIESWLQKELSGAGLVLGGFSRDFLVRMCFGEATPLLPGLNPVKPRSKGESWFRIGLGARFHRASDGGGGL
jgi:hypothetical protein